MNNIPIFLLLTGINKNDLDRTVCVALNKIICFYQETEIYQGVPRHTKICLGNEEGNILCLEVEVEETPTKIANMITDIAKLNGR